MAKKKTNDETVPKSQLIQVPEPKDKTRDKLISELVLGGLCTNAGLVTKFGADALGEISLMDSIATLKEKCVKTASGDLSHLEELLTAQAYSLDIMFCSMASRAKLNIGQYPDAANKYMNLALRAQSQCRSTVEALAEIKNPRPYIQNNKAQYQQVNNGVHAGTEKPLAHGEEKPKTTNKLLEDNTHEWMDTGTQSTTSEINQNMETVGAQHRPENR